MWQIVETTDGKNRGQCLNELTIGDIVMLNSGMLFQIEEMGEMNKRSKPSKDRRIEETEVVVVIGEKRNVKEVIRARDNFYPSHPCPFWKEERCEKGIEVRKEAEE